jgi:hypothetical protein
MANPFDPQKVKDFVQRIRASNRQELIDVTRAQTARNQAAIVRVFGQEAEIQQFVDGSSGRQLASAQEYTLTRFVLASHVVDAALKMLMFRSPYGPDKDGHYRDDHWLFVNGIRRDATSEGDIVNIGVHDEVIIINMRPYARKIEGGARNRFARRLTDRRPGLSVQAPDGVYEITARDLKAKFGTIADISFLYHGTMGGGLVVSGANGPRMTLRTSRGRFAFSGGPRPGNRSADRFPALEIKYRASTLTAPPA